jgi:hypothetical protein
LAFPSKQTKKKESSSSSSSNETKKKSKGGIDLSFPDSIGKTKVEITPPEQEELKVHLPISETRFDICNQKNKKKESSYSSPSSSENRKKKPK